MSKYNFKTGDKLKVVEQVGDLNVGDLVTLIEGRSEAQEAYDMVNVRRDSDNHEFPGCYAKRFVLVVSATPELDLAKPVQLQDGTPVTIVLKDARGSEPIKGYIGDSETLASWYPGGKYYRNEPSHRDLMNVPPKPLERELYVNVNKVGGLLSRGGIYDTRTQADRNARTNRVSCMKIKLVEGQFDD